MKANCKREDFHDRWVYLAAVALAQTEGPARSKVITEWRDLCVGGMDKVQAMETAFANHGVVFEREIPDQTEYDEILKGDEIWVSIRKD